MTKGRVLVIDDEPAVGRTIQRLLGKGYDVTPLTSGRAAISLLAGGDDFDVIFCDLSMPEVSGMDVYRSVVTTRADLADRFIFMSGGVSSSPGGEFLDRLPNARLDKPFDLETVRELVRSRTAGRPVAETG